MLNPNEREAICKDYQERIYSLMSDIEDSIYQEYSIYGQEPDKDTPFIEELFKRVEVLYNFISEHYAELKTEAVKYEEEQNRFWDNFNAWNYGLCPKALEKYRIYFFSDMEGISEFKQVTGRSDYEQTVEAIEQWKANQRRAV